jgi:hypothetical protein
MRLAMGMAEVWEATKGSSCVDCHSLRSGKL